jgi:hypothetical protein
MKQHWIDGRGQAAALGEDCIILLIGPLGVRTRQLTVTVQLAGRATCRPLQ